MRIKKNIEKTFFTELTAPVLKSRYENLEYALSKVNISGMFFEFGVFKGATINFIASTIPDHEIFGFDSWEGIPEDWMIKNSLTNPNVSAFFPKGSWKADKPKVKNNVVLIDGWFEESLPKFISNNEINSIAFLHIDSDLYSSAKTIFNNIGKYITSGTVIVFDEWHASDHEEKAFTEWLEESNRTATIVSSANTGQITVIVD